MSDLVENYPQDTDIFFDSRTVVRAFVFTNNDTEQATISLKKNEEDAMTPFVLFPGVEKIVNMDLVVEEDEVLTWSSFPIKYAINCVGYVTTDWA